MKSQELRRAWIDFFVGKQPQAAAAREPRSARDVDDALHDRRHGAVRPGLPRRAAGTGAARGDGAALPARGRREERHRKRRPHGASRHVPRDARQLQLRRLLQARGDCVGVGVRHARSSGSIRRGSTSRCTPATTKPSASGATRSGSSRRAYRGSTTTTSGRWARPARAVRARRSSTTPARSTRAATATTGPTSATASSRSGTSSSSSTTARPTASSRNFRARRSTPAPASSACSRSATARRRCTIPTSSPTWSPRNRRSAARAFEAASRPCAANIIADHARAVTFLINDGVYPSNTERGYVLRFLIRRAIRNGRLLGYPDGFLTELVPAVVRSLESGYPELRAERAPHRGRAASTRSRPSTARSSAAWRCSTA